MESKWPWPKPLESVKRYCINSYCKKLNAVAFGFNSNTINVQVKEYVFEYSDGTFETIVVKPSNGTTGFTS